ncbi:MAG TPA: DUF4129 domain-containing protein, partial [Chloroflexota bacterium]|nr:DUF4129 domain-containing protein [Chloroflexota bacterium]
GFLMQFLIETIRSLQRPTSQAQNVGTASALLDAVRRQASTGNASLDLLFAVLKWLAAVLLVAVVLWVIGRAVSRYLVWSSASDLDESRDFVWSWAEAIASVRAWLRAWWRSARVQSTVPEPALTTPGPGNWTPDIRSIYRALLRLGASRGRPRALTETPGDYEKVLVTVTGFQETRVDVTAITASYVEERYADRAIEPDQLAGAVEAMRRLEGQ